MKKEIEDLIEISRFFGANKDYTLAGGGNTSYKNEEYIWVKASGSALATIDEEGFAQLDRKEVQKIRSKEYSTDEQIREVQVKEDLIAANVYPEKKKRPSVETSFHELINYPFVVHMHPTHTNALMCAVNSEEECKRLFGEKVMYIPYAPGYKLFKAVERAMIPYREQFGRDPEIIFLENHGVFVSGNNISGIKDHYLDITHTILEEIKNASEFQKLEIKEDITRFIPAIKMIAGARVAKLRHSSLHSLFYSSAEAFKRASLPFTPDIIVYCKSEYIYLENTDTPEHIIEEFKQKYDEFFQKNQYNPRIVLIRDYGLLALEDTANAAETALEVYEDLLKISHFSENFGGPRFLPPEEIEFIDNWEVENYRRKIAKGSSGDSPVNQKICVITGGAQGFGKGIAEELTKAGANVVLADINEETGQASCSDLGSLCIKNAVVFHKTDVSSPDEIRNLVQHTVETFGGIDVYISNAGILHAGSLEEMDPETFGKMTKINYEAYFLGAKYASSVMKLQSEYDLRYFSDIIQINSKSGLKGSNKNFAYAGGKFGGVGLTQSFALELAPFRIKVNSICPGNFFEGPLWADPEKGLFVQYLKAGKVPGAESIEDVKRFYEEQVPLKRGCRVEDVVKAIYYVISQEYETGQAIPVTGGQIMLN